MRRLWLGRWAMLGLLLARCTEDEPRETPVEQPSSGKDAGGPSEGEAGPEPPALDEFGPPPPQNPWSAANALATQHGDTAASDTSSWPGPGTGTVSTQRVDLFAACPSLLIASTGHVIAVCTQISNRAPTLYLLAPQSGEKLATLELAKGRLFGGVYPYLDHEDRLLVVDGENTLLRVAHRQGSTGTWAFAIEQRVPLTDAVSGACGATACDSVVGLIPDYDGLVWFATERGRVGTVDLTTSAVSTLALPEQERVANSIAAAPEGVAVVTDHALYLLRADERATPTIRFRASYERGTARKPGQLSRGSGSTPTFFGPRTGTEYLAITDNARPALHLLVFRASDEGELLCSIAVPVPTGLGSENSPIGSGRSVIVTSTYGYPYPALPEGAEASEPESAPLAGGLTRIDVNPDERGCSVIWTSSVRSAAVPKLSLADKLIYTIERGPQHASAGQGGDGYAYTVLDAVTGEIAAQQQIPELPDPLQLAGTIAADRILYQGTILGFVRIAPEL